MVMRKEFRGCLKQNIDETQFGNACENALQVIKASYREQFIEIMLYRHHNMLFLYVESRVREYNPNVILDSLNDFLETWPEEEGMSHWAYMYPVFYQHRPEDETQWLKERVGHSKEKVGRIAFLKEEKLFSYVYWHKALVDEGLLKGDKYQYISLHENILFSYYEEPRNNMSLSGKEEESQVIQHWLDLDPGSHFQLEKTEGKHFLCLPSILSYDYTMDR